MKGNQLMRQPKLLLSLIHISLLIGCELTTIPEASLKLLKNKELIALNQYPLGLQAYVVQHENEGYVLVKDIERKRGNVRAVALYNPCLLYTSRCV